MRGLFPPAIGAGDVYSEAGNGLRESLYQIKTASALNLQRFLRVHLVNIAQELATNVLPTGLLVIEDTRGSGLQIDASD